MKIATFRAKCAACQREFACPELSDFAYGDFLFVTRSGRDFRFYRAIGCPVWELVEEMIPKCACLSEVLATLADPVSGEPLTFGHVCPTCGASRVEYWQGQRVGSREVPDATFAGFWALPLGERRRAVLEAARLA